MKEKDLNLVVYQMCFLFFMILRHFMLFMRKTFCGSDIDFDRKKKRIFSHPRIARVIYARIYAIRNRWITRTFTKKGIICSFVHNRQIERRKINLISTNKFIHMLENTNREKETQNKYSVASDLTRLEICVFYFFNPK